MTRLKKTVIANVLRSFFVCGLAFSAVTSFFAISTWSTTCLSSSGFAPCCFRRDRTLDEGSVRVRVCEIFKSTRASVEGTGSAVSQSMSITKADRFIHSPVRSHAGRKGQGPTASYAACARKACHHASNLRRCVRRPST